MAHHYYRRSGDRSDGRRVRHLNGTGSFLPYILPSRSDALNYYEDSFEVSDTEQWVRDKRAEGYRGMGLLHIVIAAYIRAVAEYPALNRFVAGRKVYSHNRIEIVVPIKHGSGASADVTTVKIPFDAGDTVFDVYRKLSKAGSKVKSEDEGGDTDRFAKSFSRMPRILARLIVWILKVLDYFGILPRSIIELSPFHGSMLITDPGLPGVRPVYHHMYNFGTLPVYISLGTRRKAYELNSGGEAEEHRYVDARLTVDGRIADEYYYASVFKAIREYVSDPEQLEYPPETVNEDEDV